MYKYEINHSHKLGDSLCGGETPLSHWYHVPSIVSFVVAQFFVCCSSVKWPVSVFPVMQEASMPALQCPSQKLTLRRCTAEFHPLLLQQISCSVSTGTCSCIDSSTLFFCTVDLCLVTSIVIQQASSELQSPCPAFAD